MRQRVWWLLFWALCPLWAKPDPATLKPDPAPEAWPGLLGRYRVDQRSVLFYEDGGDPLPLRASGESFALPQPNGLGPELRITRDAFGRGTALALGGVTWQRVWYGPDRGEAFRITPLRPVAELRTDALAAVPPIEAGARQVPELVELTSLIPTLRLDIRYAGADNFMGAAFYPEPRAFLQRPAAEALARVEEALNAMGYGLVVYDAYRPWHVTRMFWDATPPELKEFVADPAQGSRHNRGAAVDVSLVELASGKPVEMTSGYDEFSERAHPDYPGGTALQRWHRALLWRAMEREGFTVYPNEWWHYDYQGWERFPILNLTFDQVPNQPGR